MTEDSYIDGWNEGVSAEKGSNLDLIDKKIEICQKALDTTKDEKWIHIIIVLEDLKKEIQLS